MASTDVCELCLECILFCSTIKPFEKRAPHHRDVRSFEKSVQSGCLLCVKLWAFMSKLLVRENVKLREVYDSQGMTRGTYTSDEQPGELIIMVNVQWTDITLHKRSGTQFDPPFFCLSPCQSSPSGLTCLGKPICTADLSENKSVGESWNRIKSWLSICDKNHSDCRPQDSCSKMESMPARLLHISDNKKTVKAVETNSLICYDHVYIALSYCWGTEKTLKLEAATISQLYQGIDVDLLPKTYQDAIIIAFQLGIPYLWIDALCIRQDVTAEWRRESLITHHIYGNAVLTISATAGVSVDSGLFSSDKSLSCKAPLLELDLGKGPCTYFLEWRTPLNELLEKSPVSRRGWIFAERLLSRRVLHFADEQLIWECNEMIANERFPTGTRDFFTLRDHSRTILSRPWKLNRPEVLHMTPQIEQKSQLPAPSSIWNRILYQYSSRQLTRESDKLPAIAGLAARFKERFGPTDHYLAGLWRSDLALQLLWEVSNAKQPTRTKTYQAPSWSPMSINGTIFNDSPEQKDVIVFIEIPDAATSTLEQDSMGQVTDGHITLTCPRLIKITMNPDSDDQTDKISNAADNDFDICTFGSSLHTFGTHQDLLSYELNLDTSTSWQADSEELYLLPICRSLHRNTDDTDFRHGYEVRGLAISPVDGRAECYTRKGLVKMYDKAADAILGMIGESEKERAMQRTLRLI